MSRTMFARFCRVCLPLAAIALLSGTAGAGDKTASSEPVPTDSSTQTTLNDFLVTQDWAPTGDVDPTNVPVLTGDFSTLAKSIVPNEASRVKIVESQKYATGKGIFVAVLDSGWNLACPALSGRLASTGFDAFDMDSNVNDSGDGVDNDGDGAIDWGAGHGTFVASIIARCAPNAKLIPVRIANDEGMGTSLSMAEGLRYAVQSGADVINVSFHLDMASSLVQYWLNEAERLGVLVVCAAGNEGVDYLGYFAKAPTTMAVGAVDAYDRRASFSNYGSAVDIYAPGVSVQSAYGRPTNTRLARWSGTSFSSAFVSGGGALVFQRHPTWTAKQVRDALRVSVDPALALGSEVMSGGRINLLKAATK